MARDGQRVPALAWPEPPDLFHALRLSALFCLVFYAVYGATDALTNRIPYRVSVHLPLETAIPFVPGFAVIYLSTIPLLALAIFVLRDREAMTRLFSTLVAETLVAAVFFLTLPVRLAFGPPGVAPHDLAGTAYRLADTLNLEHNALPSLHVAFAFTAALVYGDRCGRLGRALFTVWALSIACSTLLIHAHHLLDVAAGVLLATAGVQLVFDRDPMPALRKRMPGGTSAAAAAERPTLLRR